MGLLKGKTGQKFGGITSIGQTKAQFKKQEKQFKKEIQKDTIAGIKKDLRFLGGKARKEGLSELRKERSILRKLTVKKRIKTVRKRKVRRTHRRRKTLYSARLKKAFGIKRSRKRRKR